MTEKDFQALKKLLGLLFLAVAGLFVGQTIRVTSMLFGTTACPLPDWALAAAVVYCIAITLVAVGLLMRVVR